MTQLRFSSTKLVLLALLHVVMIIGYTSAYNQRLPIVDTPSDDRSDEVPQLDLSDIEPNVPRSSEEDEFYYKPKPKRPMTQSERRYKNKRVVKFVEDSSIAEKTSCGKMLCSYSANYPTAEIAKVVKQARRMLEDEVPTVVFKNRGMDLTTFESKVDGLTPSPFRSLERDNNLIINGCGMHTNTSYPLEGYNRKLKRFFYIVNLPNFKQGVTTRECKSHPKEDCVGEFGVSACHQDYDVQKMLVLPIEKRSFTIQDFKIRGILVPIDCSCAAKGRF